MISWRDGREERKGSAAIYGLVVSGSVMAASGEHGTVTDVAITVFVTVLVYWIAEAYAEVLGRQMSADRGLAFADVVQLASRRFALVEASYAPLLVVLIGRAIGAGTAVAIDSGLVTAAVLLALFGWVAAQRRGAGALGRIATALGAGLFGVVTITLKTLLH